MKYVQICISVKIVIYKNIENMHNITKISEALTIMQEKSSQLETMELL